MRTKLLLVASVLVGLALPLDVSKAGADFGFRYNDACADEGFCTNIINNYCGGKIHKKKIVT